MALDDICTIMPEFPTGNGKVDFISNANPIKKA